MTAPVDEKLRAEGKFIDDAAREMRLRLKAHVAKKVGLEK